MLRRGIGGGDFPPPPTEGEGDEDEVKLGRLPLTEVGVLGVTFTGEPPGGDLRDTGVVGPEPAVTPAWWWMLLERGIIFGGIGGAVVSSPSVEAEVMLPVVLMLSLSVCLLLLLFATFPKESSSAEKPASLWVGRVLLCSLIVLLSASACGGGRGGMLGGTF